MAEVRLPGGDRGFSARRLWSVYGSPDNGPDFALLEIIGSEWTPPSPASIRWGRLDGDAEIRVHAFGFPDAMPGTELSPVVGTVHTTSGWLSGRPELSLDGGEPVRESARKSWWAGLSGGPVFEAHAGAATDILVGLVTADPPEFGSRRLRIVPVSALLDHPEALAIVIERCGEPRTVRCPGEALPAPAAEKHGPTRVFVDATSDAKEYPPDLVFLRAALDGARQAGAVVVDGAALSGDERLAEVRRSDVYAAVVGFRYGPVLAGSGLSTVDLAYSEARATGRACRMFLLDDDAPVPRRLIDLDATAIDGFRSRLRNDPGARHFSFSTAAQLTGMVLREVALVSAQAPVSPAAPSASGQDFVKLRAHYLARLRETYRRLDLDALTPSEQEDNAPVLLQQVFMPQQVRPGPPPLELPKEMQRKLTEAGDLPFEPSGPVEPERWMRSLAQFREQAPRPVLSVLADPTERLVVLLGDPGAGKSTLARHLALSLAAEPGKAPAVGSPGAECGRGAWPGRYVTWLPVMIELRAYAEQQGQLGMFLEFLSYRYRADGLGLPATELDCFLREDGRAWVIFDGLDELFDLRERENAARQIAGFAARYPTTRVLVTSRSTGYQRKILDDGGFTTFTLQDLDDTQIQTFVTNWYQVAYASQEAEAKRRSHLLVTSIKASASIRELAGNPLLLTILTIIGRKRELPRERHAMYAHAASVLVEHWEVRRYLKDRDIEAEPIDSEDKKELLRRIARVVQSTRQGREGNFIDRAALLAEFESYLKDRYQYDPARAKKIADAMLRQFRERNFILSMLGPGIYGFVHRAFLEYFCADDLRRRFETTQEISIDELSSDYFRAHWAEDTWHEVLLLAADMLDEHFTARLLADVLAEHDPSLMLADGEPPHNLALAVRAITDARYPAQLTELGHIVLQATADLLEAASRQQTSHAQAAIDFVEAEILPPLQTSGKSWPSRETYLAWFAIHGTDLAASSGSNLAASNISHAEDVTARIAAALGHGDPELLRLLRTQAQCAVEPSRRQVAVRAVSAGWHDDPGTLSWLRDRATADASEEVRSAAVEAIAAGWHDDPGTLSWLRDRATADASEEVRSAAVEAIAAGWHDDPGTLSWLRDRATADASEEVRSAAVEAIAAGWHDDPGTLSWLRDRATADASEEVRSAAVEAIAAGWHDDPGTLSWLRDRATADASEEVRSAAAEATSVGRAAGEIRIGLWGSPASGKTTYLGALSLAVGLPNNRVGAWSILPVNQASSDRLVELQQKMVVERRFPDATPLTSDTPLSWLFSGDLSGSEYVPRRRMRRRPARVSFVLEMIDVSGEAFADNQAATETPAVRAIDHLADSQGLIYLFDPVTELALSNSALYLNRVLLELSRRAFGRSTDQYLPHYLSVCVTKLDDPFIFQQARRRNLVTESADGQLRVPDHEAERFFREFCTGQFWGDEIRQANTPAQFVYNSLRRYFSPERTRYFVISSVGLRRGRDHRVDLDDFSNIKIDDFGSPEISGPIEPVNVMEPLVNLALKIAQAK